MINEHNVNTVICLWTLKGFISPEYFLNYFSNFYIPPWLWKSFKLMVLTLLANALNQKTESGHWICPCQKFLSLYPKAEGNYPFLSNSVFWKSVFSPAEREEMEQKKWLKLKHEIYSLVFHMLHKSLLLYTFFHI